MKLSPKQKEVIRLMREGYKLISDHMKDDVVIKSKEDSRMVSISTFVTLYDYGMIICNGGKYPKANYILTDLGKTINI